MFSWRFVFLLHWIIYCFVVVDGVLVCFCFVVFVVVVFFTSPERVSNAVFCFMPC